MCVNCAIRVILSFASYCSNKMENPEWITRYLCVRSKKKRAPDIVPSHKQATFIDWNRVWFISISFRSGVCDWSKLRDFNRLIVCGSQQVKLVIHFLRLLCFANCNVFINTRFQYCGKCLHNKKPYQIVITHHNYL